MHGGVLQLRLALQRSNQELPHHFIHILLAQLARRLSVGGISYCRVRLLCLSQDLRQHWHQLANHLAYVLLRKLALLLTAPLRLLHLAPPLGLRLRAPSGVVSNAHRRLTAILLAIGCLP